jgi:2-polyprenyl-3-methyl-5-hydroxy-6-metoxy-1,4-benzoquinol methylase
MYLDFGCGCGRVLRQWCASSANLYGTDYNPLLIEWCQAHLSFAECAVNLLEPPTRYRDNQFDFIYALSVFTHLPAQMQIPWLQEMKRILKPGGLIFLSVHGDHYRYMLTPEEERRFNQGEIVAHQVESAGTNYCNVFHPRKYLIENFGRVLDVLAVVPCGALGNPHQDAVLLQKTG